MKHTNDFDDFLKSHVNLDDSRLTTLTDKVDAVTTHLKEKHVGYGKYSEQGSFSHKTIIKPVQENDEFDADILVLIKDDNFTPYQFNRDYVKEISDTLKNNQIYKDKIHVNTRCVTIDYAGDFHLDVVPYIKWNDDYYICNRKDGKYEQTDGDGYKDWLLGKNKNVGGNYFRKVTRLLKFLRDHKDNFSVKSILLTTMLGYRVDDIDTDECTDVPSTLLHITNSLNDFLQKNPTMPTIVNPVLGSENFNRNWDQIKYNNFRDKFNIYCKKINDAYENKDHDGSVKKWRELFGDDFGKLTNSTSATAGSAAILTSTAPPAVAATKPYGCYK